MHSVSPLICLLLAATSAPSAATADPSASPVVSPQVECSGCQFTPTLFNTTYLGDDPWETSSWTSGGTAHTSPSGPTPTSDSEFWVIVEGGHGTCNGEELPCLKAPCTFLVKAYYHSPTTGGVSITGYAFGTQRSLGAPTLPATTEMTLGWQRGDTLGCGVDWPGMVVYLNVPGDPSVLGVIVYAECTFCGPPVQEG